jgi:PRTRC genetic system protein A
MERNLELEGMLVGHFIGDMPRKCDKPVSYVMRGDGLWEIRTNTLGVFRRLAAKARIPGLPCGFEEGFELLVPKIPLSLLWQAVAFFRQVFALHKSESAVRFVYDRKRRRYFLDCPPQDVCATHCRFDRKRTFENSAVVLELHSHGGFGAAFSSTDNRDEIADRFYGIVGKVEEFFPETCFRLSMGGNHLPVELHELFDTANDPMLGAKFPPGWLDQVKKTEPAPTFPKGGSRYLDDPDDPENANLFLPGWDEVDEDPEDDEEEDLFEAAQAVLDEEKGHIWLGRPRNRRR